MSAIISPIHDIVELVLNLEPCILQKCNTFYFGYQTGFFLQEILLLCNMVFTGNCDVNLRMVLLKLTATCSHST